MTVHVSLPVQFAQLTRGEEEFELEGATVGEVLRALAERHPPLRPLLWRGDSQFNPVIVCFVNGRQLRMADAPGTRLHDGDKLLLIAAVEGG